MRYSTVLCAAAISGLTLGAANAAVNAPTTAPSVVHAVSNAAITSANAVTKTVGHIGATVTADVSIRNLMADATNQAAAGALSGLISNLDSTTQQRMNMAMQHAPDAKLDAQVQALNKNWKLKYGHAFSITSAESALPDSFASIKDGSPAKDTQLAASVAKADGEGAVTTATFAGESSIALATVPAGKVLPQTRVSLVCEKDSKWRIDAPQSLTYDNLRQNLTAQLSDANQHSAQWPANETDAQRIISHHVLMAVMNQSAPAPAKAAVITPKASPVIPAPAQHQATVSARPAPAPANAGHWWQFWKW